jgi:hypothetical protein
LNVSLTFFLNSSNFGFSASKAAPPFWPKPWILHKGAKAAAMKNDSQQGHHAVQQQYDRKEIQNHNQENC